MGALMLNNTGDTPAANGQGANRVTGIRLLNKLLQRGDDVHIEAGKLAIIPASGKPVQRDWLQKNHDALISAITEALNLKALIFTEHATGNYHKGKAPGVTLYFTDARTKADARITFNANLTRQRNTTNGKKGEPLPTGRFRVGNRSAFIKFWQRSGLAIPRRNSEFWEYMGNLKSVVFQADVNSAGRIEKSSLRPLSASAIQLHQALKRINSSPAISRLDTGNAPATHRQDSPASIPRRLKHHEGFGTNQTAVMKSTNNVSSMAGDGTACSSSHNPLQSQPIPTVAAQVKFPPNEKAPQDQSEEEWTASYERRDSELEQRIH